MHRHVLLHSWKHSTSFAFISEVYSTDCLCVCSKFTEVWLRYDFKAIYIRCQQIVRGIILCVLIHVQVFIWSVDIFSLGCHNVDKRSETSGAWGSFVSIGWHFGCSQHRRIQSRRGIFPPKVLHVPYYQRSDVNKGNISFNMRASLYQSNRIYVLLV